MEYGPEDGGKMEEALVLAVIEAPEGAEIADIDPDSLILSVGGSELASAENHRVVGKVRVVEFSCLLTMSNPSLG